MNESQDQVKIIKERQEYKKSLINSSYGESMDLAMIDDFHLLKMFISIIVYYTHT